MTKQQIDTLVAEGRYPGCNVMPELLETHISWVLIGEEFVFKIKKPVCYSFLDFSTLGKREYYCNREIELNKRLTEGIYLDVQHVMEKNGAYSIGGSGGNLVDYAVRMKKFDRESQMDFRLLNNQVTKKDIQLLAKKIADFHNTTSIVYEKNYLDVQPQFNDLANEKEYISECLGSHDGDIIKRAIETSDAFLHDQAPFLAARLKEGCFRDCHGDLHSRNIFLSPSPQPFDCIEFNDEFRQIDVLNEVAFLCMDLDAFDRPDLSGYFLSCYNDLFPTINTPRERALFTYYKSYRANVRAKVNSLRARTAGKEPGRTPYLREAGKYLHLMERYLCELPAV